MAKKFFLQGMGLLRSFISRHKIILSPCKLTSHEYSYQNKAGIGVFIYLHGFVSQLATPRRAYYIFTSKSCDK